MTHAKRVPAIEERRAQPYVAVRASVRSEADLRGAADEGFPRVFGWLKARGIAPAGPPFIRYRTFDATGAPSEVEIAVPVTDVADRDEGVEPAVLPAGRWITFLHRGPYTHASEPGLADAHATVRAWARERAIALGGCTEQYRIGPVEERDYSRWETELAYLVDS